MKKIVIVGGGITGLSAAHYLQQLKRDNGLALEVTVIEGDEALGGKIRTVEETTFTMETGADSIVARHASVMPLVEELELGDRLVYNGTGISYLHTGTGLHAIPAETVFGIPMNKDALLRSTLVSAEGKEEALKDFETPNDRFTKESSIGEFLEAFLGKELVEKQVAPVLSGVYSGDLYELSLASTLPYLLDYKNKYGSIIGGFEANQEKFAAAANKKFISFDGGLSVLIDRLEDRLGEGATVLKGAAVERITKSGERYEVALQNGKTLGADYVILATPHQAAQEMLALGELDEAFGNLHNSSLISIYLGFDIPDSQLPADGTGFIVAKDSALVCNACTWTSRKWTHTSDNGHLLLRLFYKSINPRFVELNAMTEEELVAVALADIEQSLGLKEQPRTVEVTNWRDLMPNYRLAHKGAIATLEEKMAELVPNIHLAGSSYYGVGIGACIENGKGLAESIAEQLNKLD